MAINAYCGIMGSGKSYEVTSGPLLDAVAKGRRVVTNIDGIDESKIHAYLAEKRDLPLDRLGPIVHVTTEQIAGPAFFPVEIEGPGGAVVEPGFVQAGDFVVVDEAWKLWAADCKIPRQHIAFFRMHRHFVHAETGVACDVVLMVQSIGDLHRMLRPVIELSFVMVKLKALGMSKRYRVEMYEGWKQNKKTRTGTFQKAYNKEIFPLYKSYAGGSGTEAVVDKRQNVFGNRTLWLVGGGALLSLAAGAFLLYGFFHPAAKGTAKGVKIASAASAASGAGVPQPAAPGAAGGGSDVSATWRVAGCFQAGGLSYVVLVDTSGRMRVDSPGAYVGEGAAIVGRVDGQRVSMWSGGKATSLLGGAAK